MYAGVPNQGAADAAYQVMLDVEYMTMTGVPYCGGGRCHIQFFDQILRPLVYVLLSMAGMPRGVVAAYRQFLESLITYNVIAGGLGHGHRRACGIPQGCPFSMMVVALIMRPWLVMMKTMSVMPRVLADDVLSIAQGRDMLKQFANALDACYGCESRFCEVRGTMSGQVNENFLIVL